MARVGFIVAGAILLIIGIVLTLTVFLFFIGIPFMFIGVILVIIGAVTSTQKQKSRLAAVQSGAYNDNLKELNDRLMRGEISKSEYKQLKKTILK
jgi:uncharacterized membrane protein